MKNFDLSPVGSQVKFPEGELEPVQNYLKMASITIKTHGGKFARTLNQSEDAISYVAYSLMLADLKWREGKGTQKSSWRIAQGKFAISKYLKRLNRMRQDPENLQAKKDISFHKSPLEDMILREEEEGVVYSLNNSGLKPLEYEIIKLRLWENQTFKEIGEHYKITKQAAVIRYNKALERLKTLWTN